MKMQLFKTALTKNRRRNDNEDIARIRRRIESLEDRIEGRILSINKKYGRLIQKLDFPADVLEDVCLRKIFLN
jgi:hypothetical protein